MKFPVGLLLPASSPVGGSDDVGLLGRPVDRFSPGFWMQPQLAKVLHSCTRDTDTEVTKTLKQDVQELFALRTRNKGPASPSPNLRPGGQALGSAPSPPDRGRGPPRHGGSGCWAVETSAERGGMAGRRGGCWRPGSGHLGQPHAPAPGWPDLVAQVPPRREVCGKFCSCFPARASRGVVTQRLGLLAGTEEREGEVGRLGNRAARERAHAGVLLDPAYPPLRHPFLSRRSRPRPAPPPLPLPRCPLPFPSTPQTLLPGSALLPPPSLRPGCLLPPPPREASLRPDPEEDASPLRAVITAQPRGCHHALRPCALGPRVH